MPIRCVCSAFFVFHNFIFLFSVLRVCKKVYCNALEVD